MTTTFQLVEKVPLFTVVNEVVIPSTEGLDVLKTLGHKKVHMK